VRRAGRRLGHVHLDDNDGQGDVHWSLLTGRLTTENLEDLAVALRDSGYRGGLTLELNPANDDPIKALGESKVIAERLLVGSLGASAEGDATRPPDGGARLRDRKAVE